MAHKIIDMTTRLMWDIRYNDYDDGMNENMKHDPHGRTICVRIQILCGDHMLKDKNKAHHKNFSFLFKLRGLMLVRMRI
jgi:hypothetical protein